MHVKNFTEFCQFHYLDNDKLARADWGVVFTQTANFPYMENYEFDNIKYKYCQIYSPTSKVGIEQFGCTIAILYSATAGLVFCLFNTKCHPRPEKGQKSSSLQRFRPNIKNMQTLLGHENRWFVSCGPLPHRGHVSLIY